MLVCIKEAHSYLNRDLPEGVRPRIGINRLRELLTDSTIPSVQVGNRFMCKMNDVKEFEFKLENGKINLSTNKSRNAHQQH